MDSPTTSLHTLERRTDVHRHPPAARGGTRLWITVTRRFGKPVTVVDGFGPSVDLEAVARDLKQHLGAAGSAQHGRLELQGDQASRLAPILREMVIA